MSKELEALKRIRNVEVCIGNDLNTAVKMFDIDHEYDKAFEIIEKELNDYYLIKNILDDFDLENPQNLIDNLKIINSFEKKLKALDIIKNNKDMRIAVLSSCKKWDEYDLLKEVLK